MKIYGNMPPEGQEMNRTAKTAGKPEVREKAVSGPTKALTDKVEISSKSKEVAELMSAINQMPRIREDKIKAIQDALTSGAYSVDPHKIAEKILREI